MFILNLTYPIIRILKPHILISNLFSIEQQKQHQQK